MFVKSFNGILIGIWLNLYLTLDSMDILIIFITLIVLASNWVSSIHIYIISLSHLFIYLFLTGTISCFGLNFFTVYSNWLDESHIFIFIKIA